MTGNINQTYRYLDTQEDREALLADMRAVRREVIAMREIVPESEWYAPRYHGWSLAAMLGHLQTVDTVSLWQIQLALIGFRPVISLSMVNQFNNALARVYQQRVIATSVRGIEKREKTLANFILTLPIDKFTVQVYHAPSAKFLTVEQAMQQLFLHHWQDHLRTMREAEGLYYEPPQDKRV